MASEDAGLSSLKLEQAERISEVLSFMNNKGFTFNHLYEFHNLASTAPAFVPAELPARYTINFIPTSVMIPRDAVTAATDVPDIPVSVSDIPVFTPAASYVSSTDYSVISSVNFVVDNPVTTPVASVYSVIPSGNFVSSSTTSTTCIETT